MLPWMELKQPETWECSSLVTPDCDYVSSFSISSSSFTLFVSLSLF
jgi:hypothetical protein